MCFHTLSRLVLRALHLLGVTLFRVRDSAGTGNTLDEQLRVGGEGWRVEGGGRVGLWRVMLVVGMISGLAMGMGM